MKTSRTPGRAAALPLIAAVTVLAGLAVSRVVPASSSVEHRIAFTRLEQGVLDLHVMNAGGGGEMRLTDDVFQDEPASWSPQGLVAFQSNRDGNTEIYTIDPETLAVSRITNDPASDASPVFSPDGSRIAFVSDRAGPFQDFRVWVMDSDGANAYNTLAPTGWEPTWSPDGARLAYIRYFDVFTINASGSGPEQLTTGGTDASPDWSPDGTKIAFDRFAEGQRDIYVVDVATLEVTQLTTDPATDTDPTWIGDGSQIAFVSERDGNQEIYVMDADGGDQTRLTSNDVADRRPTATKDYSVAPTPTPTETPGGGLIWGDTDCNGGVTIGDAQKIARDLVDLPITQEEGCPQIGSIVSFQATERAWGDTDCSGEVSIGDAQKIARRLVDLPVTQAAGCPLVGVSPVLSSGTATLHGTWSFDFDAGAEVDEGGDMRWRQETDVLRYLVPKGGAQLALVASADFESLTYLDLLALSYSDAPIDGSDNESNQLPAGTVFAVRTNGGNYAKVRVLTYGFDLELEWVTYG